MTTSMFLAFTADDHLWDKSQKLLFLSQACLLHDARRSHWQGLDYEILPNLWHDPQRLKSAIKYVDDCAEKLLGRLGRYLSELHQVPYHEGHWRIILYSWLQRYIHVVFDRFSHIRFAFENYGNLTTGLARNGAFQTIYDLAHYTSIANSDSYNYQICSHIVSALNDPFIKLHESVSTTHQYDPLDPDKHSKTRGSVFLYNIHYRHEAMIQQLEDSLNSVIQRYPENYFDRSQLPKPERILDNDRLGLARIQADDLFEQILIRTLPQTFPTLYLEGYSQSIEAIQRLFPTSPQLIISSAHGWYTQEVFKFFAAVSKTRGSRIVSMQAGGSNGLYHYFSQQAHEQRLCDREFVWGWAKPKEIRRRNVPCFYTSKILSKAAKNRYANRGSKILFLQAGPFERFLRWIDSTPYGGGSGEAYIEWQKRFFGALRQTTQARVLYREKPQRKDGQHFVGRIAETFPKLEFEDTYSIAAPDRILDPGIRIIVADHCSTGYLESLAANKPTVLFWNSNLWLTGIEGSKLCDEMRDVNILHDSPESAAEWVERIYESPSDWWLSDRVQNVRQVVVNQFGWGTEDWLKYWRETVLSELEIAKRSGSSTTIDGKR